MRRPHLHYPQQMAERQEHSTGSRAQRRLRFELIFGSVWLAIGLFALPALIYSVGITLLGPYGEGGNRGGLGSFYGDFFGDLAEGEVRTWLLALGPLLLISLLRLVFIGTDEARQQPTPADEPATPPPSRKDKSRVEPSVGAE